MVRIRFDSIKIDTLSNSSSVNNGINIVIGRTSRDQRNEGMGSIDGKNNRATAGHHVLRNSRPFGQRECADPAE